MTLPPVEVVLYQASGCGLCEAAQPTVEQVAGECGVRVRLVDIEGDPELERRYRIDIPVVEVDGQRVATYVVAPSRLEAAVRAAQARRAERSS